MQLLQPLAIEHVRLAAADVLDLTGVGEQHREALLLQQFEDRDPEDSGGFHDDRVDRALFEPSDKALEIWGEGGEFTDANGIATRRDSDEMGSSANIDSGGIKVEWWQADR